MKRLAFVLFAVAGCIDSSDEAAELLDEAPADEMVDGPSAHVSRDLNPLGTRCGVPLDPPLDAEWVWGDNGIPIGLQVELLDPVDRLNVEFHVLNGATIDTVESQRSKARGTQVFDLSTKTLEEAADFAAEGGAPFGSVSALVTAHDATGEAVAAGNASTVHFKRDRRGTLTGFTPSAAAAAYRTLDPIAPELKDAYPDAVFIEGVDQANTYVRVYRSNPGE